MQKLLTLCLALIMLTALAVPAAADVIVEPEDLFYATHRDKCEYIRARSYLTNSEAGYVYLYQSPDNALTVKAYPNGEHVTLTWLYTAPDGETWGIIHDESGWLRLSDLSLIYDSQEFLKDHGDKCVPYGEKPYTEILPSTGEMPVLSWTYPGGERSRYDIPEGNVLDFISQTYTDENGTLWGYIGYMYGMRDFWVCLSAPYDESVGGYALSDHEITLKQAPLDANDIPVSEGNAQMLLIVGALVVGVVIGTAVIIRTRFTKTSSDRENDK